MNEPALYFDHFQLKDGEISFVAFNEHGKVRITYSREWVSDNVGTNAQYSDVRDYLLKNKQSIESAAIAAIGASPHLGSPFGDSLPYAGYARVPFNQFSLQVL